VGLWTCGGRRWLTIAVVGTVGCVGLRWSGGVEVDPEWNTPQAQTTRMHLASFGPVMGLRWAPWAALANVGLRGSVVAFVGLCWRSLAFLGDSGSVVAFVGRCWPALAIAGSHNHSLHIVNVSSKIKKAKKETYHLEPPAAAAATLGRRWCTVVHRRFGRCVVSSFVVVFRYPSYLL